MHALHCFISNRCKLLSGKAKEIADIVLREALLGEVSDTPSEELHGGEGNYDSGVDTLYQP